VIRLAGIGLGLLIWVSLGGAAYDADLRYVDDIEGLTTSCRIRAIKLVDGIPESVVWDDPSDDLAYGELTFADSTRSVIVDRAAAVPILYVDGDGSGAFEETPWLRMLRSGDLLAGARFRVSYENGTASDYRVYLLWSPYTPTVLAYCRAAYREGEIELEDAAYRIAILDEDSDARYDDLEDGTLFIDADGDGDLLTTSDSHERYGLDEPFDLGGTDYRVAAVAEDGAWIRIEKSDVDVAPKPPLLVGFEAPLFEAVAADGGRVALHDLRGRVVLLDFWAGWCGPCVDELPTIVGIDADFAEDVVVVGINLDRSPTSFEAAVSEHGLTYTQVFDGPDGPIAALYRIEGIPMTYLIDRDGVIRARGLRGESLRGAIETLLGESEPEGGDE
jgi:thiol-disulfide isomerase/thioredoxin